jgi:hypothetical protein
MEPGPATTTDLASILAKMAAQEVETATLKAALRAQEAKTAALEAAQAQGRPRLPGRLLRAGLAAGIVALLLGSTASAAIPNATTNVFSGCYRSVGGMNPLYVLDTAQQATCPVGMTLTAWQAAYRRIVVVSPIPGGTNQQNGTALLSALQGITNAGPTHTNPYLLKIEPGMYDLNGATLSMQPYVDIEGSGEDVTTITSNTTSETVSGAKNAELRWLTVQNTDASGGWAYSALALDSTARVTHVTASGATGFNVVGGAVTLQAVTTPASDGTGVLEVGATVSIQASALRGSKPLAAVGGTFDVATSLVAAPVSNTAGTYHCVGDYNASFVALGTACS